MFHKIFLIAASLMFFGYTSQENREYTREYFASGQLKAEGWVQNGMKTDYWKIYHPNGKKSAEGHFRNNEMVNYWHFYTKSGKPEREGHFKNGKMGDWWLFYDQNGKINHKCQLKDGQKNGYCLKYRDEELTSAEKYSNGRKVKEWFSFSSFRKENKLSDLK